MGDPIKTGLVTTNFLLNYGFDKIPASAFAGDTYRRVIPGVKRKNRRAQAAASAQDPQVPFPESESEEEAIPPKMSSSYPTRTYTPESSYSSSSPQYSRAPPRQRPEYMPRNAQDYYPPPPSLSQQGSERSSRRPRDDDYANYNSSVARRPNGAIRRTSSFNGRDKAKAIGKAKDAEEEEETEEKGASLREDFLTKSPEGLAAGGIGAVLGGWLSEKAQVKSGREERGSNHLFLTGLGAVAGGLAANAAVDYLQHKRKADERTDKKWDDKFGAPQSAKERNGSGNRIGKEDRGNRVGREDRGSRVGKEDRRRGRDADYARSAQSGSGDVDYGRGSRGSSGDRDYGRDFRRDSRSASQKASQYADSESLVESEASYARGRYHGERDGRGYQPYGDADGYTR